MALPTTPLLLLLLLLLTTLLSLQPQPLSASQSQPNLLLPLIHTQSHHPNSSLNLLHLLKSSSLRSASRHHRHRNPHPQNRQLSLPLSSGSDYTLSFSIGDTTVDLYMDTGSDLVWFPCAPFECILCEGKPIPTSPPRPPPPSSTLVPCSSPSCSAAHSSLPSSDLCAISGCSLDSIETSSCSSSPCPRFYYAYGDGSLTARLRRSHLSFSAASLRLPNFTFACAHTALAEPIGVAGFGQGLLSLPNQLSSLSPSLGRRFSYCLLSHSFKPDRLARPSPLILGRSEPGLDLEPFIYTPLLPNPKHPYFYTVGLTSVSIGSKTISAGKKLMAVDRDGNGGIVVDSGTTFTMLPAEMHTRIADEFDRQMVGNGFLRTIETESETGLGPCYYYSEKEQSETRRRVPSLSLRFTGNATVVLPRRNYFMGFTRGGRGVGCLMVMSGWDDSDGEDSGGPAGTLGNFQQQGFEVVYDLDGGKVGFAKRRCSSLWDTISRG